MIVPNADNIESAIDTLKKDWGKEQWVREDQQKELTEAGEARLRELGISGLTDDVRKAYELGVQTGRVLVSLSSDIVIKGVDSSQVL